MMQMIKMHFRIVIYSIMQKGSKLKYILKWFPKTLQNLHIANKIIQAL